MVNYEFGHQAEEYLMMAAPRLGIPVLDRSQVGKDPGFSFAISRATEREDFCEGTDFWFYANGEWVRLDLTTARDPEVLSRKENRENVFVVRISGRTLRLAAQGCRQDLIEVLQALQGVINEVCASLRKV